MKLQPRPITSSLGSKYVMAVTGLLLTGFVVIHMAGNLLIYAGPGALNSYAQKLKETPALLWTARLGLLTVFVVHLAFATRLRYLNKKARPKPYVYEDTLQASWASRHMMLTGLALLAFILFHLAHFTLGWVKPATVQVTPRGVVPLPAAKNYLDLAEVHLRGSDRYVPAPDADLRGLSHGEIDARHDVYSMAVNGFRNPYVVVTYLIAMAFLGLHLWHGGSSWLQSLGLTSPGYARITGAIGPVLAVVLVAGNCSIPLAVWLGIVP